MVESYSQTTTAKTELQLPYKHGHELGLGVSVGLDGINFKSCPFEKFSAETCPPTNPTHSDYTKTYMLRTTSDYSQNLKANASFEYGGWGPSVQASFSTERNLSYKSDKALIINHRVIDHGFEKFKGVQDPPLSEDAKEILQQVPEMFEQVYGEYYVCGFTIGSSYWLQCEILSSDAEKMTNLNLQGSVKGLVGSGQASGSFQNNIKSTQMFSNTTRHLSGHHLDKLSTGPIDITTGAQDMVNFQNMCSGVRITTHLKAYRTHPKYMILAGAKMIKQAKILSEAQSNDIYECLVTLNLLLKVLDELLLKKVIDFTKKQTYFDKVRNLQHQLRSIQEILPIDPSKLNALVGENKKLEYELVTLLKETVPASNKEESIQQDPINAIVNKPVTIKCWLGTYLSNDNQWAKFANQNRLLQEQFMILPLGSGIYIVKSFKDGNNLGLTTESRGVFTGDSETAAWQWKIEYSEGYFYFVSMYNSNVMHASDITRECLALNTNRKEWERMIVEPVSITPGSTSIEIKPRYC